MATLVRKSTSTLSSSSLKRKRPPTLDIPNVLREIEATAGDSVPRKSIAVVDDLATGVGVFSRRGKKRFMEDAYRIASFSPSDSHRRFFGVFDGHGGKMAAEFASESLHKNVVEMMKNCAEIEEAVRAGYLKTNQDFLEQGLRSGTCCVTAVIEGQKIAVSNVGDCRAVLCRGGAAQPLTRDHTAEDKDEQNRIENKGGYVEIHRGAWRVHGVLAVSRSIGDAHLKDWVSAEPETKVLSLTPDMEFIVLASDGLWEQVGNQEAVDTVKRFCLPKKTSEPSSDNGYVNSSPLLKLCRVSLSKKTSFNNENETPCPSKRVNTKTEEESPMKENIGVPENNSERLVHESPRPIKLRRVSLLKRVNTEIEEESSTKENTVSPNNHKGLVAACKELVDLAVKRGGLDDITVMVIDLKHYLIHKRLI